MTKKEKIVYAILIITAVGGVYLGRYAGGFLTGAAAVLLVVMITGKQFANKAIQRIDKQVKDIIVDNNC